MDSGKVNGGMYLVYNFKINAMKSLLKRAIDVGNKPTCKNCKNKDGDKCHLCCIGNTYMSGMYWESKHKDYEKDKS